jgi:hypothetical protein
VAKSAAERIHEQAHYLLTAASTLAHHGAPPLAATNVVFKAFAGAAGKALAICLGEVIAMHVSRTPIAVPVVAVAIVRAAIEVGAAMPVVVIVMIAATPSSIALRLATRRLSS